MVLQQDRGVLELDFGGQGCEARLLVRGLTVRVYFGTRGFVWEVWEFQFCYVVGSLKYKPDTTRVELPEC